MKLQEPKSKGMILEPEHKTEEPSAVRSLTLEAEDEAGAGKTEREASESTRNWWEDRPEKNSWNWQVGKMLPPALVIPTGGR